MVRLAPNFASLDRRSAEHQFDGCHDLQRYGHECDDQYLPVQCHHFSIPHDSVLQGKGQLQPIETRGDQPTALTAFELHAVRKLTVPNGNHFASSSASRDSSQRKQVRQLHKARSYQVKST
jgi:hypothetical protein